MNRTLHRILEMKKSARGLFALLLDPDKLPPEKIPSSFSRWDSHVDFYLLGSSYLMNHEFDQYVLLIKKQTQRPVLLFPGNLLQVSRYADALLFLSVLSGRNPEHLIGVHVQAAPLIHQIQLETISLAYLLIESGKLTAAQYLNHSLPIPRDKPGIAVSHALAAQYFGFQMVYLEAGSGALLSVPEEMIQAVKSHVKIPLMVGGGIRTPQEAAKKVDAGADIVVIGNHFEQEDHLDELPLFAKAIHGG